MDSSIEEALKAADWLQRLEVQGQESLAGKVSAEFGSQSVASWVEAICLTGSNPGLRK